MSRTWTDEQIYAFRDAMIRAHQQMEAGVEGASTGRAMVEVVTQLVAERQALRDHLGYLLARFVPLREDGAIDADRPVTHAAYLSDQEYRQLRAALPEERHP